MTGWVRMPARQGETARRNPRASRRRAVTSARCRHCGQRMEHDDNAAWAYWYHLGTSSVWCDLGTASDRKAEP